MLRAIRQELVDILRCIKVVMDCFPVDEAVRFRRLMVQIMQIAAMPGRNLCCLTQLSPDHWRS